MPYRLIVSTTRWSKFAAPAFHCGTGKRDLARIPKSDYDASGVRSTNRDGPFLVPRRRCGRAGAVRAKSFRHALQLVRVRGQPARVSRRFEQVPILPNHGEERTGQRLAQIRGPHVVRRQRRYGTGSHVAAGIDMREAAARMGFPLSPLPRAG